MEEVEKSRVGRVGVINKEGAEKKKRGRKRIKEKVTIKDQKKFFVDYSNGPKEHELVVKLMMEVNKKDFGREVVFKDLVDFSLKKLTDKDLEKIQEMTLGKMDKVQMLLDKHNLKHETNIDLGEFLVRQLKIS